MALIENERAKLTATWLNGLSVACFAIGALAPTIQARAAGAIPVAGLLEGAAWLSVSVILHFVGRRILARLRE